VPTAAFLSGGIDSSAVVAAMSRRSTEAVDTFSVGFEELDYDESFYAQMVAKQFSCKHHLIRLRADDFLDELPNSLDAVDHPGSDGSSFGCRWHHGRGCCSRDLRGADPNRGQWCGCLG
ncbi:MAG: hypothetical protein GY773_10515, partial [Actinomycetia bacterium]|nr:hypothetical protein [Actinomycetes bacterium]